MKILVIGAAGFIGFCMARRLIDAGHQVVGLDSLNSYYDIRLKYARLGQLGIKQEEIRDEGLVDSAKTPLMSFVKMDLTDRIGLSHLFEGQRFDCVVNLAGQAGVRYYIDDITAAMALVIGKAAHQCRATQGLQHRSFVAHHAHGLHFRHRESYRQASHQALKGYAAGRCL